MSQNQTKAIDGPGEALRRAMLDALREIEARLAEAHMSARDVHLARRAAKRARALARLAPAELAALARDTRTVVDRARRALGEARDAEVRAATLDALKPRLGDAHGALVRLARDDTARDAAPVDLRGLRDDIAALIRDWTLCAVAGDLDGFVAATGATYRRMRKRAAAARDGDSEALHRWRAAVVDFEYDTDFLAQFSADMKRQRRDADRLRKHLGEINDLDDLCGYVGSRDAPQPERAALDRLAQAGAARRARLLARAFAIADTLLVLRPGQWMKAVRRSCER